MNDRIQAATARSQPASLHSPDESKPSLNRQRGGVSGWVVLAVAVPVFFATLCAGLLAVAGMMWWVYADFDLPAPDDDPPPMQVIEPEEP